MGISVPISHESRWWYDYVDFFTLPVTQPMILAGTIQSIPVITTAHDSSFSQVPMMNVILSDWNFMFTVELDVKIDPWMLVLSVHGDHRREQLRIWAGDWLETEESAQLPFSFFITSQANCTMVLTIDHLQWNIMFPYRQIKMWNSSHVQAHLIEPEGD